MVRRKEVGEIRQLKKYPGKPWLVGFQSGELVFFDLEGKKLDSFKVENPRRIRFTEWDDDSEKELAYSTRNSVKILDVEREEVKLNQSLADTVFVGAGKEVLKAVALNQTVVVAKDYSEVEDVVERTGKKPVGVGKIPGIRSVENVNRAFNVSRERWFVDSREKAVLAAALAAEENATLTFEKGNADRDLSNLSARELRERFIEEFKPHHLAVADLDSDTGLLAGYMAVKQGILPLDFDREYSYPGDVAVEELNRDNGVIKLDGLIEKRFREIGENINTVFDGKHVSLLEGPRKVYRDPVEKSLFGDPADGKRFRSDLGYGNLDGDRELEAGVGRYPGKVGLASELYLRSLKREKGDNAVVAGEYLHSNWPVVLATLGGGMLKAKLAGYTLENQGYQVTRLVEQRSRPFTFMTELLGLAAPVNIILNGVRGGTQEMVKVAEERDAGLMVKHGTAVLKGLRFADKALKLYLEFDWRGWKPLDQEIVVPEDPGIGELRESFNSFLPPRYRKLNQFNLKSYLEDRDVIYYQGVGNSSHWILPNRDSSLIKDRYTGENSFSPGEFPEMERSIVWDSSDNAVTLGARKKDAMLEKGAAAVLGTSTVNYVSYSAYVDRRFLKRGGTVGEALVHAVNELREPSSVAAPGNTDDYPGWKMSRAFNLYGNPETVKDPVTGNRSYTERCSDGVCVVKFRVDPDPKIREVNGSSFYLFGTDEYLLQAGMPITPLYSEDVLLPRGAEILSIEHRAEYMDVDRLGRTRNTLLTHGNKKFNYSPSFSVFPQKTYSINVSENKLTYIQVLEQYREQGGRVLEKAVLTVEYAAPYMIELQEDNGTLEARVRAERSFNGTLGYRIDSREETLRLELNGSRTVELGALSPGTHRVEAYLYRDSVLASDREKVRVAEPLDIYVFAPDMHRMVERSVRVVVENPNDFGVGKSFEVETSENVRPAFLEEKVKTIQVSAGGTAKLNWRVMGTETGKASVSVAGETTVFRVLPGVDATSSLAPGGLMNVLSSPRTTFRERRTSEENVLVLETPRGKIRYRKTPAQEKTLLKTGRFTAEKYVSPEKSWRRCSTAEGEHYRSGRKTVTRGSIAEQKIQRCLETLGRELELLKEMSGERRKQAE